MDGSAPRRVVFIGGLDDGRRAVQELSEPSARRPGRCLRARRGGRRRRRGVPHLRRPRRPRRCCARSPRCATTRTRSPRCAPTSSSSSASRRSSRPSILDVPPLGVIGFHTAVLPGRRGSSPVIWAMIDGLEESGVTMFYMDEGIDTGDVIAVERFPIEADDYAADVLRKADDATLHLLRAHLDQILDGTAPRTPAGRDRQHLHPQAHRGRRGDRLESARAGDRPPDPGALAALPARPHLRRRRRAGAHREGQGRAGAGPARPRGTTATTRCGNASCASWPIPTTRRSASEARWRCTPRRAAR